MGMIHVFQLWRVLDSIASFAICFRSEDVLASTLEILQEARFKERYDRLLEGEEAQRYIRPATYVSCRRMAGRTHCNMQLAGSCDHLDLQQDSLTKSSSSSWLKRKNEV